MEKEGSEEIQLTEKDQQVADVLAEAALTHKCVSFTEISQRTGIGVRQIGKHLSPIGRKCRKLGLPVITVLVVYKGTNKVGKGYKEFEPKFPEHPELAEQEKQRVWAVDSWDAISSAVIVEPDCIWSETFKEGTPREVKRTIPIRNSALRGKCLEKNGCVCAVCGFDPKKVYGEGFERTIEVHHLYPVANGEREVTVDDLIPVCAICHRALHAKGKNGLYTPEELKKLRKERNAMNMT